jgi:hypothetical protein
MANRTDPARQSADTPSATSGGSGVAQTPLVPFVINMVPQSLSGETNQDSEPHLTVNPANTQQIVGTAFTPAPAASANAPVYVSLDGGNSWFLNVIVPSAPGSNTGTGDITTSFNSDGSRLYGAILRNFSGNMEFLRSTTFSGSTAMTVLASRPNADQPFTQATTMASGPDAGKDRVYIGSNDFNAPGGMTQTVDLSLNAAAAPGFNTVRVEKRVTAGQDGPQCRPALHADGTVYAAFYRWRSMTGNFGMNTLVITSADVVVVRDDSGGSGGAPFTSLLDPVDHVAGLRVAQAVSFPFNIAGTPVSGQQRIGGSISIAVDPRNSSTVYLAWGDQQTGSFLTLHVRRSTDRGVTWSATDLLTVPNATNAALAVNSTGLVGLLCQQVSGSGSTQTRTTRVSFGQDGSNWQDTILAVTSATQPPRTFNPYLGDYDHMVAVGEEFFGIFSASNLPAPGNFPSGIRYQRNANFVTQMLLNLDNATPVNVSIDPFFFRFTRPTTPKVIGSAQFPNVFLRMDGSGVTAFSPTGGGTVNCQSGHFGWEEFNLVPQSDGTFAIGSVQFPNVFLRMDGSGVSGFSPTGSGIVNCQFGVGPWEKFNLVPQTGGTFAIASAQFPGVFLRMDGSAVSGFNPVGSGIVNCQSGVGPWERFQIV